MVNLTEVRKAQERVDLARAALLAARTAFNAAQCELFRAQGKHAEAEALEEFCRRSFRDQELTER